MNEEHYKQLLWWMIPILLIGACCTGCASMKRAFGKPLWPFAPITLADTNPCANYSLNEWLENRADGMVWVHWTDVSHAYAWKRRTDGSIRVYDMDGTHRAEWPGAKVNWIPEP